MKKGFNVNIEKGAGVEAKFRDEDYLTAGGKIVDGNKAFDSGEKDFPAIICRRMTILIFFSQTFC